MTHLRYRDIVQPHTHADTHTHTHTHTHTCRHSHVYTHTTAPFYFVSIVFHSYSLDGSRVGPMISSSGAFSKERIVPYWTPLGFGPVEEMGNEEGGG